MRKLVFIFGALFLITASAFAAEEINVRGGVETGLFAFKDEAKSVDREYKKGSDFGLSFSGEYLYSIIPSLKAGLGFQYVLPRSADNIDGAQRFSWFPIYATAQFYPSKAHNNAYIKGSAGYTMSYIADTSFRSGVRQKDYTGFYLGTAIGIEFNNLFIEAACDYYNTRSEIYTKSNRYETVIGGYTKYGVNIGWKFKVRVLDKLTDIFASGKDNNEAEAAANTKAATPSPAAQTKSANKK